MFIPWYPNPPCQNGHVWEWASISTDTREHPPNGTPCRCGAFLYYDEDMEKLKSEAKLQTRGPYVFTSVDKDYLPVELDEALSSLDEKIKALVRYKIALWSK